MGRRGQKCYNPGPRDRRDTHCEVRPEEMGSSNLVEGEVKGSTGPPQLLNLHYLWTGDQLEDHTLSLL